MRLDQQAQTALLDLIREAQDRAKVLSDIALDLLEEAEQEGDDTLTPEMTTLTLRRGELYASLALGARIDLAITLLSVFSFPDYAEELIGEVDDQVDDQVDGEVGGEVGDS